MKLKKNLALRLIQTIDQRVHEKFLTFVSIYKPEILDFTKHLLKKDISEYEELIDAMDYSAGSIRVYKTKLKDAILEYHSIFFKNKNIFEVKRISHVRVLNNLGEEFLPDALQACKKDLASLEPYVQASSEINYCVEITRSVRSLDDENIMSVVNAAAQGAKAAMYMQKNFEVYSFYIQSTDLLQRYSIIRSKMQEECFEKIVNHPARFLKYTDFNHYSLKYFWLAANNAIEFYSRDLTLYLSYAKKKADLGKNNLSRFPENVPTSNFIIELELSLAFELVGNAKLFRESLMKLKKLIPLIPSSDLKFFKGEYYDGLVRLAILDRTDDAPIDELKALLEEKDSLTTNAIRHYRISLVKYYLFNRDYDQAQCYNQEILNEPLYDNKSISELEVLQFLVVIIQLSVIVDKKEQGDFMPNDLIYFKSLIKSYKEKIRKRKEEFELEMLFLDSFSKFGISSFLKDIREELNALRERLQQHEEDKTIFYQIQFKRIFDYDRWLEQILT